MIEYLIEYLSKLVNVNFLQLGLSEKVVKVLVRGSLFLVGLSLISFVYKIVQGPLMKVRFSEELN